jgi:prepilin-type N-terminal cleavage/methylation domain-containing protein/prepilin-type processing-associated H-X9-DG protein
MGGRRRGGRGGRRGARPRRDGAFTLIELLVSITIIAVLVSLLLPALARMIGGARQFRCQIALRSIAFDFSVFADEHLHGDRGLDEAPIDEGGLGLGDARFRLGTFQESQYRIDEFWDWDESLSHALPDRAGNDPMRCAEVRGRVVLKNNIPCGNGAVGPRENVSYGFNKRLEIGELELPGGVIVPRPLVLQSTIMEDANVPLAWDVDGAAANAKGVAPVFSAPSLESAIFKNDKYWFPSRRHNGGLNVAFIGGHVLSSRTPLEEDGWRWSFSPPVK